ILYFPGGLAQLVSPLRDRMIRLLGRLHGIASPPEPATAEVVAERHRPPTVDVSAREAPPRVDADAPPILEVRDLRRSFGGMQAVAGVSLAVRRREILGLIGPNGAGKTTLFEMIGGFTRPDSGTVLFQGKDITRMSPERRCVAGLVRSFQDARLFP